MKIILLISLWLILCGISGIAGGVIGDVFFRWLFYIL